MAVDFDFNALGKSNIILIVTVGSILHLITNIVLKYFIKILQYVRTDITQLLGTINIEIFSYL